jgi:hypothetical protein
VVTFLTAYHRVENAMVSAGQITPLWIAPGGAD